MFVGVYAHGHVPNHSRAVVCGFFKDGSCTRLTIAIKQHLLLKHSTVLSLADPVFMELP